MTLPRVLEPELMDSPQEAFDYDQMDHSEVNRRFAEDFLALGIDQEERDADLLDLGTGTAQIPIEICRRHRGCRVMAADAAVSMLELARYKIEIASLIDRIQLMHMDAKQLPCQAEMFDGVISNSIIHHIPEPLGVLKEAVRVARPGGLLFFRDLLRPASEAERQQLVQTYGGDANEHQRRMFAESLHAALTLDEIRDLVSQLGFAPETVQQTSDRHWTWVARKAGNAA